MLVTPWTVARQAPLSVELSQQEYWSGLLFPSPEGVPRPGLEPESPVAPALAGRSITTEPPGPLPVSAGDGRGTDLIPGLGRSPGVGNGNPLQY